MRISTIRQRSVHQAVRRRRSKQSPIPTRTIEAPSITPHFSEDLECDAIVVECQSGLAQIKITNGTTTETMRYDCSLSGQKTQSVNIMPEDFDQSKPLRLEILGCNGRVKRCSNAWKMVIPDVVRIPNSKIILRKQSAIGNDLYSANDVQSAKDDDETDAELDGHKWAVMLQERGADGKLSRAKTIDLRVGAILDGAVVYYEDGHSTPCGLRLRHDGSTHQFGGSSSRTLHIPSGVDVVKVEVNKYGWGHRVLGGISMTLSDGTKAGTLNSCRFAGLASEDSAVKVLEAGAGEKIVGFFGNSGYYTQEFGIITGPKDVELPARTYDMAELQNIQTKDWARNMY
ncbi:unnamed protein product [Aureobasidium mustum]|uniref:F5/8 type C domain-containing protein n=1 Tax=Aureobasidium mustum TaxID=2773714 RepID=A0A9N8JGX5_9PEZI|nr:unnamed protein product [Aureobasidium mustum]